METGTLWRSVTIGYACGLRSMTGPAVARWFVHDPLRLAFAAMAAGELVADKLPATPARTIPPALAFRALAGAYAGRTVAVATGGDGARGMLAGAAAAIAGAYLGMALRARVVAVTRIPDPIVALVEDTVAIGAAVTAVRT